MTTQEQIEKLVAEYGDEHLKTIVAFLPQTTFYTARCHSHHTYTGGLAVHSLGVARLLMSNKVLQQQYTSADLLMAGLLHDLCKAHFPADPQWDTIEAHHHGTRSAQLISSFFHLHISDDVYEAIRCHMHHAKGNSNPLWAAIYNADHQDAATAPRYHRQS